MNLKEVQKINRETLETITSFIEDDDYYNSPDNYGLPQHVYHLIDLPINEELTYVDLMMLLQSQFSDTHTKYVEIGVSVLKTFYQVSQFLNGSHLYAFDINKPNPTITKKFDFVSHDEQLSQYTSGNNNISYFQGDVFNTEDFSKFKEHVGSNVNIIFSDAHHTRLGLAAEYTSFIKDALADEFILYYDDLGNDSMRHVFLDICADIYKTRNDVTSALLETNGWLGQYEHAHVNGIVTSIDLQNILSSNKMDLPNDIFQISR